VEQKWKDALNIAAAEPTGWGSYMLEKEEAACQESQ
jgi:hypothetical protein